MHTKYPTSIWAVIAALALITLACGLHIDLGSPTAVQSPTPFQLPPVIPADVVSPVSPPTNPPGPTIQNTSVPLPAVDVAATEAASRLMADVKDYYQSGYLPFENGQLYVLDDFSKTRATNNLYDFTRTGHQSQDFALWADIELNTIGSTTYPDYTGCGFAYRVQNGSEGYTAILTNTAVRMGSCHSSFGPCTLFGTTHGTGVVDVPNKSRAQFSLAVNKDHAWVLVDGTLVGQYSLYTTKLMGTGDLDYAVVSNINAGYMTSCQITNVHLWVSRP